MAQHGAIVLGRLKGGCWQRAGGADGRIGLGQRSFGQRNGGKGMGTGNSFCLHSFASIPLPNPFRELGFRFRLAMARWPDRCSRRQAENPSVETAQHGILVAEKWRKYVGRRRPTHGSRSADREAWWGVPSIARPFARGMPEPSNARRSGSWSRHAVGFSAPRPPLRFCQSLRCFVPRRTGQRGRKNYTAEIGRNAEGGGGNLRSACNPPKTRNLARRSFFSTTAQSGVFNCR